MLLRYLATTLLASAAAAQLPDWYARTTVGSPMSGPYLLEFDPVARGCLLFARSGGGQTWSWDGHAWQLRSATAAIADVGRMAWDSVQSRMLIVTSGASSGQTRVWAWSGATWTLVSDARPFLGRDNFAAAFDDSRGVLVLHGGARGGSNMHDTWEFDGTTWRQRSSGGPSPRDGHTMTYDPVRHVCVLFGGQNIDAGTVMLGDVWEWDGSQWREFFGVGGPAPRVSAVATYDPVHRRVLVYGGTDRQSNYYRDLWGWNGTAWQAISTSHVPPNSGTALAFDALRGVAVLPVYQPLETWEFYDDQPTPGVFTAFGTGCAGTNGVPALTGVSTVPRVGEPFVLSVDAVSVHLLSQTYGILGTSTTTWNGFALPLSLGFLGAPGCSLFVAIEDLIPLPRVGSTVTWTIQIPFDRRLVGQELDLQALIVDPGANSAGVVVSNGVRLSIGN